MKMVLRRIKFEWAYAMVTLCHSLHRFTTEHREWFNEKTRRFIFNSHLAWTKRFLARYGEME